MPYSLHADEAHKLIELVYTGEIESSTRVCAMEDGDAMLSARGYRRALVDLRDAVPAPESPGGGSFPPFDLLAGNMAVLRHSAVGYFHRREDAVEWLLLEPDA